MVTFRPALRLVEYAARVGIRRFRKAWFGSAQGGRPARYFLSAFGAIRSGRRLAPWIAGSAIRFPYAGLSGFSAVVRSIYPDGEARVLHRSNALFPRKASTCGFLLSASPVWLNAKGIEPSVNILQRAFAISLGIRVNPLSPTPLIYLRPIPKLRFPSKDPLCLRRSRHP